MYAQRAILRIDPFGKPKNMPQLPPNRCMEAIFLDVEEDTDTAAFGHRFPNPEIAGKLKITGNVIDTAPEAIWDLPR